MIVMKRLIIFLLVAGALFFGYKLLRRESKTNLELNLTISGITEKIGSLRGNTVDTFKEMKKKAVTVTTKMPAGPPEAGLADDDMITLYLKHGGVVSGKLLGESEDEYIVFWRGEQYIIDANTVDHVERGVQGSSDHSRQ